MYNKREGIRTHNSGHLRGIHAGHVAIKALPLGNPALLWVGQSDEPFEDGRGAVGDVGLVGALHLEEVAVGAAQLPELGRRLYEAANHTGAQVPVL